MSLKSAKNIIRRSWDTIPMPETVIDHVIELACNEKISLSSQTSAVVLLETPK